ncbi:carbohydrate kinase family protein [Cerasicoccus maritimus]|uniref:carbohydrate kinase family protein n=1 Tax=Cerasicoccus maritimus TaxID=490089 RepID=UPI0028527597|nr:carbohydrate kinase [Cerasicoccus maritimus]
MPQPSIICFGEILWDCLPRGLFLGGAPFNVACHLAQLGADSHLVSTVGKDFLGDEALRRAEAHGVGLEYVLRDNELPTGTVIASLSDEGNASYTFPTPVAWDEIHVGQCVLSAVKDVQAIVYGTLALRLHTNRERLESLLTPKGPMRCLDVNLREPYDDVELALKLAAKADLVKLNEIELGRLTDSDPADSVDGVASQCTKLKVIAGCQRICVTRGAEGGVFWDNGEVHSAKSPPVEVKDTVGAGDAFMAALIFGLISGQPVAEALKAACARGAMIAGQDGAV